MADMPEKIYAERDEETNEKRWFSTLGMGTEYIRADLVEEAKKALEYARSGCEAFQSDIDELCEECGMNPAAANQYCDDRMFVIDEALSKLESKQ